MRPTGLCGPIEFYRLRGLSGQWDGRIDFRHSGYGRPISMISSVSRTDQPGQHL
jgi:hypothetical protein